MAAGVAAFIAGISFLLVAGVNAISDGHLTGVRFGYAGSIGPANWGRLSHDYHSCSNGKTQSPIDIVKKDARVNKDLAPLIRDYKPANATLVDNIYNVGLRWVEDAGILMVQEKNYTLKQMHWHLPSEHTIDGIRSFPYALFRLHFRMPEFINWRKTAINAKFSPRGFQRYPAELHLVHQTDDGHISVVAILYDYGNPDPFLYRIKEELDQLAHEVCSSDEEAQVPIGVVRTKNMRRGTRKYFRYMGSLTTPPCTENVIWNILGKVRHISREQVDALKAPLKDEYKTNARPLQPLNGRQVELYVDDDTAFV